MCVAAKEGPLRASALADTKAKAGNVNMVPRPHAGEEGGGIHENVFDTVHMLVHSRALAILTGTQCVGLLFYETSGMVVTGELGAIFRSILETMRTLFVWVVGLVLYYAGTGVGEQWDHWSWLQVRSCGRPRPTHCACAQPCMRVPLLSLFTSPCIPCDVQLIKGWKCWSLRPLCAVLESPRSSCCACLIGLRMQYT